MAFDLIYDKQSVDDQQSSFKKDSKGTSHLEESSSDDFGTVDKKRILQEALLMPQVSMSAFYFPYQLTGKQHFTSEAINSPNEETSRLSTKPAVKQNLKVLDLIKFHDDDVLSEEDLENDKNLEAFLTIQKHFIDNPPIEWWTTPVLGYTPPPFLRHKAFATVTDAVTSGHTESVKDFYRNKVTNEELSESEAREEYKEGLEQIYDVIDHDATNYDVIDHDATNYDVIDHDATNYDVAKSDVAMSDGIEFNATKFDVKPDFEDAVHSNTSVTVIPDIPDIPDIPVNPVNPDKTAPSNLDGNEQIIFKSRRNVVIPKSIALDSNKQTPRPAINGKPRFKLKNKTNTQKNIYSDLTGKGPNL